MRIKQPEIYQLYKNASFTLINASLVNPENITFGIFGSMSATSDIDVGIQYSGKNPEFTGLASIVLRCEQLFLIFTNVSSLHFDIEIYADLMTITRPSDINPNVTEEQFI